MMVTVMVLIHIVYDTSLFESNAALFQLPENKKKTLYNVLHHNSVQFGNVDCSIYKQLLAWWWIRVRPSCTLCVCVCVCVCVTSSDWQQAMHQKQRSSWKTRMHSKWSQVTLY